MPPPPPKAPRRADDAEDASEWTMPSLSDDPHKARRKLEKMLREISIDIRSIREAAARRGKDMHSQIGINI
jgi:hypothetical protein